MQKIVVTISTYDAQEIAYSFASLITFFPLIMYNLKIAKGDKENAVASINVVIFLAKPKRERSLSNLLSR